MNGISDQVGHAIKRLLQVLGLRTIKSQYTFSYLLIFLLTAISAASLYLSLGSDATSINIAGRQRMLLQKVAKETLLFQQGVVDRTSALKTIELFETSHRNLLEGNKQLGLQTIEDAAIRTQMNKVLGTGIVHVADQGSAIGLPQ